LVAELGWRLGRDFFSRRTIDVARALIGCELHTRFQGDATSGRIVETEAYLGPDDLASHAARLRYGRQVMIGPPAVAYIYRSYGIHSMMNVVSEPPGRYGAVLIRALEPLSGLNEMAKRRGTDRELGLCSGPGRLTQALGIGLKHDGVDLQVSDLIWIVAGERPHTILASGRIGISRGQEAMWRFFDGESAFVSAHRRGLPVIGASNPDDGR
jgi:DNA-3-methyladenine glycosylase